MPKFMRLLLMAAPVLLLSLQTSPGSQDKETSPPKAEQTRPQPAQPPIADGGGLRSPRVASEQRKQVEPEHQYELDWSLLSAVATAVFTGLLTWLVVRQIRDYRIRERAWVVLQIETHEPIPINNQFARIKAVFQNFGQTPAHIVSHEHRAVFLDTDDHLPAIPGYFTDGIKTGGPETDFWSVPGGGMPIYWTVKLDGWEDAKNGTKVFYVFGRICYRDIFKSKHETRYCFRYYPARTNVPFDVTDGFFQEGPSEYKRIT